MKKLTILSILFLSALFLSACNKKLPINNNANTDIPSTIKQDDLTVDESGQAGDSATYSEENIPEESDLSGLTDQELLDKLETLEDESFDSDLDEITTELN
ncbi:hypothetical protein KKC08_00275 [Patescibacteria group bacterium]|nr:hypothetical protein [Patescibacteria group bacterium]MCG2701674.1 hypothetical protein [Candidatus Parcubacteria bacterium]MBU4210092.1 hypothetical protein [Patescibacteria group bacterium]MBU4265391.1 hypothetical protein [Patescibacteria group bacterium]MBU4390343.1 hypothetical protein [Patescibacteria group bacterium]